MNTGQLVSGLPLYELPMPCAELVRRLGEMEAKAWSLLMDAWDGAERPRVSLLIAGLAVDGVNLRLAQADGVVQVEEWGRGAEVSLTDLGRRVVVAPAGSRAEFVERFEAATAAELERSERRKRERARRRKRGSRR